MSSQLDPTIQIPAAGAVQELTPTEEPGTPDHRVARLALYAGILLLAAGWIVLYLGYNGAATHPREIEQLPYVISGGLGGAALILLGGAGIIAHIILRIQATFRTELRAVREAMEEMSDTLSRLQLGGLGTGSTNGSVVVMRGGTSFHRPECRLVLSKPGLRHLPAADATRKGLIPCRVCKP